jgi:uncharacterized protein YaiI (UPF0178 family)
MRAPYRKIARRRRQGTRIATSIRIWVDADACPREAKDVIFRAAQRTGASVTLVANKSMFVPAGVTMMQVPGGPDVADDAIATRAAAGDIVITADIPLAARVVPLGAVVIDPRGEVLDEENVGERLSVRDFMADVRDAGVVTGGPRPYSARDKQHFASALDAALHRLSQARLGPPRR